MGKEEDINRLETALGAASVGTYREIATQLVNAGFGYIGDAEAKQPAQPGELTRQWLDEFMGEAVHTAFRKASDSPEAMSVHGLISKMGQDDWGSIVDFINQPLHEAIQSRILSDRATTEARVRAEMQARNENLMELINDRVSDINTLRATIADLEKRLESAVEIPEGEKWPHWAVEIRAFYYGSDQGASIGGEAFMIPRPTPAKLTPEQMAEECERHLLDTMGNGYAIADVREVIYKELLYGKTIETLYAEIKGGV